MSRMSDEFAAVLPEGWSIPDELERAFTWIEAQPWQHGNDNGYFLTPYDPDEGRGVLFRANLTPDYMAPSQESAVEEYFNARVVQIAEISGSGSTAAMWREDDGAIRYVALGDDGDYSMLAESTVDFLRLISIGYDELVHVDLSSAPDEEFNGVEETAAFRAWVCEEFSVEVPEHWEDGSDRFGDWCEALANGEIPA